MKKKNEVTAVFSLSVVDRDKSKEDRDREEELLQQINKLVETRDFLVDDVEFERLRWDYLTIVRLREVPSSFVSK